MGRSNYVVTLITDGEWKMQGQRYVYTGDRKAKALVVSENIKFDALKGKIVEKIAFDDKRYELEVKYVSPHAPNLPPFDVNDDDDFEAFKFLNMKSSKDGVWPIELYLSVKSRGKGVEDLVDIKDVDQEVKVLSSAPTLTQTQTQERVKQADRIDGDDDRTIDEILSDEDEVFVENPDRKFGSSDRMTNKKTSYSPTHVLSLSSDEDDMANVKARNKGKAIINLSSEEEDDVDGHEDVNIGGGWDELERAGLLSTDKEIEEYMGNGESLHDGGDILKQVEEIDEVYHRSEGTSDEWAKFEVKEENVGDHRPHNIKVGDYFNTKKELKDALVAMAMRDCFELKVRKSDTTTYVVGCKDKSCIFSCRGSKYRNTNMFNVRKFIGVHSCGLKSRQNHHKNASSSMIAEKMIPKFSNCGKGINAKDIMREMKEMGVTTSYHKANRARLKAQDIVRGSAEESYTRLYSWMYMLEKSNPGSHTAVVRDANNRFKYAFWSLGAWIRAMPHLRKVISVDAAHLSAKYRGVLFLATTKDGNKHIYPLAYGVADSENDASWSFFFKELKVVVADETEVVFVSDRHASIGNGLKKNYVFAKHGYCIFHIYQNFKGKCRRGDLLDLWNKVAKAYTKQEFNHLSQQLCNESPEVGKYVEEAGVEKLSRAHFAYNRYDVMTTNNAETMNSRFREERGWPIVAMFDAILETMCKWFCDRREKFAKWNEVVTEEVKKILDARYMSSVRMSVRRLSQFEAEVIDGSSRFEVNLQARTCDCRVFQVYNIPCAHAIATAKDRGVDVADLVDPMLKMDQFQKVYKETLHLVPPMEHWEIPATVTTLTCHPPQVRRPVGRPETNRFRSYWEKNWSKARKCGRCGKKGHYQTKCTTPLP